MAFEGNSIAKQWESCNFFFVCGRFRRLGDRENFSICQLDFPDAFRNCNSLTFQYNIAMSVADNYFVSGFRFV